MYESIRQYLVHGYEQDKGLKIFWATQSLYFLKSKRDLDCYSTDKF